MLVITAATIIIMSATLVINVATIVTMTATFVINVAIMVIVNGTFVAAVAKSAERGENVIVLVESRMIRLETLRSGQKPDCKGGLKYRGKQTTGTRYYG